MSKSVKVELIYGFISPENFSQEDIEILKENGVTVSPLCYTTEDKASGYIVGQLLSKMNHVGEPTNVNFLSPEELAKIKTDVMSNVDKAGYDLTDRKFSVHLNAYYW